VFGFGHPELSTDKMIFETSLRVIGCTLATPPDDLIIASISEEYFSCSDVESFNSAMIRDVSKKYSCGSALFNCPISEGFLFKKPAMIEPQKSLLAIENNSLLFLKR